MPEAATPTDSAAPQAAARAARKLVVVTGSGRSGTSTVAGALKLLGLSIPQPEIQPDESNPRGFFEPRWAVDFHKRALAEAGVHTLDGRPEADRLVARAVEGGGFGEELAAWLRERAAGDQVVVKDPRAFWVRALWRSAADEAGFGLGFVTMLRHPAEVVGSREIHYLKAADADRRRTRETGNLVGWVNVTLTSERSTRDDLRCFVPYADLLADWRATMSGVGDRLGLRFSPALDLRPHPVDEFVDAGLRRSQLTFDDLHAPEALKEVAGQVWQAVCLLVEDPHDPEATGALDGARERYTAMYDQARLLVQDHVTASVDAARRQAERRARPRAAPAPAASSGPAGAGSGPSSAPMSSPVPAFASLPRRVSRRLRRMLAEARR